MNIGMHIDSIINRMLTELMDLLVQFDRTTGRRYTLLLIPHNSGEKNIIWNSSGHLPEDANPEQALELALYERERNKGSA